MLKTIAIRTVNNDPFLVSWNLGRRCNYDCTYCDMNHHNNVSPHKSLEELIRTFEFVKEWVSIYADDKPINISFTGGEPTANPNFWKFAQYVKDNSNYSIGLTTNGTWGKKFNAEIEKNVDGMTISYHCEADPIIKRNCIDNIIHMSKTNKWMQVNLMLHVDYWDECVAVYNELKSHNIKVSLRPIGDGNINVTGWFIDADGSNRRTSHDYTPEQTAWFFQEMGVELKPTATTSGASLGRSCCGGRCLEGKVDNEWQSVKHINTEFKDWYCSVNHYFLYIDQETGLVYHHQTCQAKHDGTKGSIGSLDNTQAMIDNANKYKDTPIQCPNQRCGCGMCVPKAKELEEYNEIRRKY
jgi:organic radical activating enzyme